MKNFTKLASLIFAVIAALHLMRLIYGWDVLLDIWEIPLWISGVAVAAAGTLSWGLWKESR